MKITKYLLISALALLLSGCSAQGIENLSKEAQIKPGTTQYELKNDEGVKVAENDTLALMYQESMATFNIVNKKDQSSFYSISRSPAVSAERSLFVINYLDAQGNFLTMNTYSDSVSKGQYRTEYLKNGIKISFTLGEVDGAVLCPMSMSIERFESFLAKIENKFARTQLSKQYYIPKLDKMQDDAAKEILERYPGIDENPMYILKKADLSISQKKEISDSLISIGYTEEDYLIDSQGMGKNVESKSPVFDLSVYLTLEEDHLQVRMPIEEIREYNDGKILSINFLNYFGAPEIGEVGSYLLPDGTGSLMGFYNGKDHLNPVKIPVYGSDKSVPATERIFKEETASLPIYGICSEKGGMLCVIADGESFAEVQAWPGNEVSKAYAGPRFVIRQNVKTFLNSNKTGAEAFVMLQKDLYEGTLQVDYYLFNRDVEYLDEMADTYASALYARERNLESTSALYLEFIGATYEEATDMSFLPVSLVTYTTLADVREILEDIVHEIPETPLVVKLRGFGKHGLDERGISAFSLNRDCGTEKELMELLTWGQSVGIDIYLDYEPQYVDEDKLFDNFLPNRHSVTLLTRVKGVEYPYNQATMVYDTTEDARYILNTTAILKKFDLYTTQANKYKFAGLSLGEMGKVLNSNFEKNNPVERQESSQIIANAVKEVSSELGIITNGANAYLLPYLKHVQRIELSKEKLDVTDTTIPFLQMVLHGYTGYSDYPVNLSTNSEEFIGFSLNTGAGFTYVLTGEGNLSFRESEHTEYFSTQYTTWRDDILEKALLLKEYEDTPIMTNEEWMGGKSDE